MEKLNDHKYLELADEICINYTKMCNNHCCGECRYAFLPNCKILFTLDYLNDKAIEDLWLTKAVGEVKHKAIKCNEFYFDNIEED
ncbi:hypothetical protein ACSW9O_15750 (plasmid) [Clostridium perfringens]|nr:hypothetical protein [Clostridium perfringens]